MISGDCYIEGRASVANCVYLSPAKQEFFYRRQLAVETREWERMSAAIGRVMKFA